LGAQGAFEQHTVALKGYDTPTVTYGGTYADLNSFLKSIGKS